MKPDRRFVGLPKSFWAHVRAISQKVGYTRPGDGYMKVPRGLTIPKNFRKNGGPRRNSVRGFDLPTTIQALSDLGLETGHIVHRNGRPTRFGATLAKYFDYRAKVLNSFVEPRLM